MAAFDKIAGTIDGQIKSAAGVADQAGGNYRLAASTYSSFISDLKSKFKDGKPDPKDPQVILSNEERVAPLLDWSQAACLQTQGRIYQIGAQAATIISTIKDIAQGAEVPMTANLAAAELRGAAKGKFDGSVQISKKVYTGQDMARIMWIGYMLDSIGNQGVYATSGSADSLKAATSARANAVSRNQGLSDKLTWISQ